MSPPTIPALPKTLQEWRYSGWEPKGTSPRDVWDPLEQFFRDQGLILWKSSGHRDFCTVPPNDIPRCPDAFAYITKYNEHEDPFNFDVGVHMFKFLILLSILSSIKYRKLFIVLRVRLTIAMSSFD